MHSIWEMHKQMQIMVKPFDVVIEIARKHFPILNTKKSRFIHEFSKAAQRTIREIETFDDEHQICKKWLALGPFRHFWGLFCVDAEWNRFIVLSFKKSGMNEPSACWAITQAYYWTYLRRLNKNNDSYKVIDIEKIESDFCHKMTYGREIVKMADGFEVKLRRAKCTDDYFGVYIETIITSEYPTEVEKSEFLSRMWMDSRAVAGLAFYTTECFKYATSLDGRK